MGKRKRSKSRDEKHLRKKIERLKEKLNKRRRLDSSSSSSSASQPLEENLKTPPVDSIVMADSEVLSPMHSDEVTATDVAYTQDDQIDKSIETELDIPLNPELLQVLGEDPTNVNKYGDNLHKDIIPRWNHILIKGLDKEVRSELCKQYLPPQNCGNIRAPKLNPLIQHFLSDVNKKKEVFSENKQNQLSSCLAALGQALNKILSSKETQIPLDIVKSLSDAGRLLCDFHYRETQSRRYAIINVVNKDLRHTLKNTNIDEFLFGADLADQLKFHKEITKAALDLRNPRPPYKPQTATSTPRGTLNYRGALGPASTPRAYPLQRQPTTSSRTGTSRDRDHRRHESSNARR
nr:uncharacterized protein LOC117992666 isoform X1 [Maniola hyperantus]